MTIQTERLALVSLSMEHLAATHAYSSDPEITKYMMFLPVDVPPRRPACGRGCAAVRPACGWGVPPGVPPAAGGVPPGVPPAAQPREARHNRNRLQANIVSAAGGKTAPLS